jgi:solute carrier family 25 protein 16
MPEALTGHAATTLQPSQPPQMAHPAPKRLLDESPPSTGGRSTLPALGDASLAVSGASRAEGRHIDKTSLDYIARSGVAGGLAGCAVSPAVRPQDLH